MFDSPDRYGKGLDWTGYTVHDAANILRRYLNQLPQPIVPLDFYERCRDPLRSHQAQAVGDIEAQSKSIGQFDHAQAILTYQHLITELPPLNRQLLLYILDLLAVFSSKSELNLMTAANLAAIFQPGMLSHPNHDMSPQEYRLSQDVLIFLIENQDSFLIGMSGTAADEKTVQEVQSGAQSLAPNSPLTPRTPQSGLGRSASSASAGADSLRKFGGIRRNVSVSSKNSAGIPSPAAQSPGSSHGGNTTPGGMHRSNTLPSKKSPNIPSSRLYKPSDPPTPTSAAHLHGGYLSPTARTSSPGSRMAQAPRFSDGRSSSTNSSITPTAETPSNLATVEESGIGAQSKERLIPMEKMRLEPPPQGFSGQSSSGTPTRERKVSNYFGKPPTSDSERKETRQPNKLRKKRLPGSSNPSAHSSVNSLPAGPESPSNQAFYTPLPTPGVGTQCETDPMGSAFPTLSNTDATPVTEAPPLIGGGSQMNSHMPPESQLHHNSDQTLKPSKSPTPSTHSRNSVTEQTDQSEADHTDDPTVNSAKNGKKHRWRLSSSGKRNGNSPAITPGSSPRVGANAIADNSTSSIGSFNKAPKSITSDSHQLGAEPTTLSTLPSSSTDSTPSKEKEISKEKEGHQEPTEKKGPIGWLKAKVAQAKEEKREREAEKERTKSPPRNDSDHATSKQSLSAIAHDGQRSRGRSVSSREGSGGAHVESGMPPTASAPMEK